MSNRLSGLHIDFVSLVRRGADQDAHVVLAKTAGPAEASLDGDPKNTENHMTTSDTNHLPEGVAKALEGVELSAEQTVALLAALAPTPAVAATPAPVEKSAEVVILEKRLAEQEEVVKAMRDEAGVATSIAFVRKTYPALAVDAEALGAALYRLTQSGAEADVEIMKSTLAAANGSAGTAVTLAHEYGSAQPGDENTAASRLEKMAKGLTDANPTLTPEQAFAQALQTPEGRKAYGEAEAERMARIQVND